MIRLGFELEFFNYLTIVNGNKYIYLTNNIKYYFFLNK